MIKKLIQSYRDGENLKEIEENKEKRIQAKIESGSGQLVNELMVGLGNYCTQPGHYLVLNEDLTKGIDKFMQGATWCFHFLKSARPESSFLNGEIFGASIGIFWLSENFIRVEETIDKAVTYWQQKKPLKTHFHSVFLASVYAIAKTATNEWTLPQLPPEHIYSKLLNAIQESNETTIPLITEACNYHLEHVSLMGNKTDNIEFTLFELIPYEILCFLNTRKKIGFENPVIDHPLMHTAFVSLDFINNSYDENKDKLLNMILKHLKM